MPGRSINVERRDLEGLSVTFVGPLAEGSVKNIVILCHGFGAPGDDLVPCSVELIQQGDGKLDQTLFVFPAAPIDMAHEGIPGGRAWWPINMAQLMELVEAQDFSQLAAVTPEPLPGESDRMLKIVDALSQEYSLEKRQIVIGGFSQGAMLATDVGLRLADKIGGIILWSGTFLAESRWKEFVDAVDEIELKVVQSHGRMDPVLPFPAALSLRDFLTQNRMTVNFVEFSGYHQTHPDAMQASAELIARL